MIKCSYCGNTHEDCEIDEENYTCHQCGMPIGYTGENEERDEEEEVNEFFNDEENEFDDPDALTDEDLAELLEGVDDIDDEEFEDDDFDDEEGEEDY